MAAIHIRDLSVEVQQTPILRGVNLTWEEGETIALLGPNGHGKSTLLAAIMGNPRYAVTGGSITWDGRDLLAMPPDERSKAGIFLGVQYPAEIPGLNSADFYKAAMNAHREKPLSLFQFYRAMETAYRNLGVPFEMSKRNLNEGFSGGEKKRNEILQMELLSPRLAMLDEIDSGLDVDALNVIAEAIHRQQAKGTGFLLISHYARLLDLLRPTRAVIMINGRNVVEGGPELIAKVDAEGYEWIKRDLGIEVEKQIDAPMNGVSIGVCATRASDSHEQ